MNKTLRGSIIHSFTFLYYYSNSTGGSVCLGAGSGERDSYQRVNVDDGT